MRRRTAQAVLLLFALLYCGRASAALKVQVYNTENGLPHDRINGLYSDSRGYVWICTDDGVARFDGHQLVTYTTADGLPHIHVNGVLETRAGEYWFGTDGGLSRFDPRPGPRRFTNFVPPGPLEARYVNAIAEEPDGRLTVATNHGVFRFSPSQPAGGFEALHLPATGPGPVPKVHQLAHDAQGQLWLATENGLFQRRHDTGWIHYGTADRLPDLFVTAIATDAQGRLWVGFRGGFGRIAINPSPGSPVLDLVRTDRSGRLGREVRALWFGRDGRRWIGTDAGLREWRGDVLEASHFEEHPIFDSVRDGAVLSLGEDAAGSLWIGTRRNGVLRSPPSDVVTFGTGDGLRLGRDQTLLETTTGDVALFDIGDTEKQVYTQHQGRFVATRPALPAAVAAVPHWLQSAKQDRVGAWWFSTVAGLYRFPALRGHFDLHLLADAHVDRFFEDAARDLWISNWRRGHQRAFLTRYERASGRVVDETYRLPPQALAAGISAFAQDHVGSVWIGLQRPGGVYRLRSTSVGPAWIDIGGHINSLFVDSQGHLWIASTESGLGLVPDPQAAVPQVRRFARAQGLSSEEVWCITEDQFGRIYAGTARGLDRLNPATGEVVHLSSGDGLARGDIRSALRDAAGNLWFASASGVSRLSPRPEPAIRPSIARITGLRIGGVPLPLSEFGEERLGPLQLRPHQNSLQVDVGVIDLSLRAPPRYQYRLQGVGLARPAEVWQDSSGSSNFHFIGLPPGSYALNVRALTRAGRAGPSAVLTFTIRPPAWRTWWFQLATALSLAGAAFAVHRHRLRSRLVIERVRSHIAMDLHDDVAAGLSRIAVVAEALKARVSSGDDDARQMLNDVAVSSRALIKSMSDIVWALDPRQDEIGELVARLRAFGADLLEAKGVEWSVEAPSDELGRVVSPHLRRQLYLVFKEAIHNVAKHSNASRAVLRLQVRAGFIHGDLIDDGSRPSVAPNRGTGLASMRTRVAQLGGSIDISASRDQGTRVHVEVPLRKHMRWRPRHE